MQRLEVSGAVRPLKWPLGVKWLMMYKAKVAVCSEIRTKHSKQSEQNVEFFNVKPGGT
jgi:hypothetical protein